MGYAPVSWACWAIRAEGSTAIEEGRGSREVRLLEVWAVDVRRGSRDIVGENLGVVCSGGLSGGEVVGVCIALVCGLGRVVLWWRLGVGDARRGGI